MNALKLDEDVLSVIPRTLPANSLELPFNKTNFQSPVTCTSLRNLNGIKEKLSQHIDGLCFTVLEDSVGDIHIFWSGDF